MSLIEHMRPCICGRCDAWSKAVRDVYFAQVDGLLNAGAMPHDAAGIASAIAHGGLFSRFRPEQPERWIA